MLFDYSDSGRSLIISDCGLHIRWIRTHAMVTCGNTLKAEVLSSRTSTAHVWSETIHNTGLPI
jgi:hypothetical protein